MRRIDKWGSEWGAVIQTSEGKDVAVGEWAAEPKMRGKERGEQIKS